MQHSTPPSCVLRLYSGPLQGCEFLLEQPCTLFVTAPQEQLGEREWTLHVPPSAIYLPSEGPCNNFEIVLAPQGTGCVLRELGEPVAERTLTFQQLHRIGDITFALRPQDQAWEPSLQAAASIPPGLAGGRQPQAQPWRVLGLTGCILLVLLAGAWFSWRDTAVHSIEKLVAGAAGELQVVHGNDRSVYVFAGNERDLAWARQVMTRNGHSAGQVLTPYLEVARLQRLLAERMPLLAWHRIDFSDVRHPRLWISQQRNRAGPEFDRSLENLLRAATPYARSFEVQRSDDHHLARLAEQALAQLALPYERSSEPDGVTYTVRGSLQDTQLSAVRDLVVEFYRQWGDRYIRFAVQLEDDWLQGKSFQYGPQGYIKMTPSSWHFSQPL